jgi:Tetratricopeptide repeat
LQKFVAADPLDRWSRLALADAYYRLNRLDEAERVLEALSASDPGARAKRIAIAIAMDRGDFAGAESLLAEGDGSTVDLARLRGQFALNRRDGPAAVRAPGSGWPLTATRSTPRASGLASGWSTKDSPPTDTRTSVLYYLLIPLAVAAESTYIANRPLVVVRIPSRSPGRQTFDRLVE